MEVKLRKGQWVLRWPADRGAAADPARDVPATDPCARCDRDDHLWITVPDLRMMPRPAAVYACSRCGTVTAHAVLRLPRHSIGD